MSIWSAWHEKERKTSDRSTGKAKTGTDFMALRALLLPVFFEHEVTRNVIACVTGVPVPGKRYDSLTSFLEIRRGSGKAVILLPLSWTKGSVEGEREEVMACTITAHVHPLTHHTADADIHTRTRMQESTFSLSRASAI